MINKLKNKRGSAMLLVLILFVALTTFSIALTSSVSSGVKQTSRQNQGIQATYIARSGIMAIEEMLNDLSEDELARLYEELLKYNPIEIAIDNMNFENGDIISSNIQLIGEELTITVIGKVQGVKKEVVKVILIGEESSSVGVSKSVSFDMALFTKGVANLGGGKIVGDVGTNDDINVGWGFTLGGYANLLKDKKVFTPNNFNVTIPRKELPSPRQFDLPLFPEYPSLPSRADVITKSGNTNLTIKESGSYKKINIANNSHSLTVDTSKGDIALVVDDMIISGDFHIEGNNRVRIYTSSFKIVKQMNNVKFNKNRKQLEVYYDNTNKFEVINNAKLNGSIYIKEADIHIGNSGQVTGNIITGGKLVDITGAAKQQDGVIYAPIGIVNINNGSKINGAVVGDIVTLTGNPQIIYTPENTDYLPIIADTDINFTNGIVLKEGYFK